MPTTLNYIKQDKVVAGPNIELEKIGNDGLKISASGKIESKDGLAREAAARMNSGNPNFDNQIFTQKSELNHSHDAASPTVNGFMSSGDKTKLDAAISATASITLTEEDSLIVKAAKAVVRFVHNGSRSLAANFSLGATLYVFNGSASQLNGQVASYYATAAAVSDLTTVVGGKLGKLETAADSSKLGGQLPAYYATTIGTSDMATKTFVAATYATILSVADMLTVTAAAALYATKASISDMLTATAAKLLYLGINAKATDSDKLNGKTSDYYALAAALDAYKVKSITQGAGSVTVADDGKGGVTIGGGGGSGGSSDHIDILQCNSGSITDYLSSLLTKADGHYVALIGSAVTGMPKSSYSWTLEANVKAGCNLEIVAMSTLDNYEFSATFTASTKTLGKWTMPNDALISSMSNFVYQATGTGTIVDALTTLQANGGSCNRFGVLVGSGVKGMPKDGHNWCLDFYSVWTYSAEVTAYCMDDNTVYAAQWSAINKTLSPWQKPNFSVIDNKRYTIYNGDLQVLADATSSVSGTMSTADKAKLDGAITATTTAGLSADGKSLEVVLFGFNGNANTATKLRPVLAANSGIVDTARSLSRYLSWTDLGDGLDINSTPKMVGFSIATTLGSSSSFIRYHIALSDIDVVTIDVDGVATSVDYLEGYTGDAHNWGWQVATSASSTYRRSSDGADAWRAWRLLEAGGAFANALALGGKTATFSGATKGQAVGFSDDLQSLVPVNIGGGGGTVKTVNSATPDGSGNINVTGLFSDAAVIPNAQIFCNRMTLDHLSDLNNIRVSGAYWCYKTCSYVNAPAGWPNVVEFILDTILVDDMTANHNTYIRQTATRPDTGEIQTRFLNHTTWTPWRSSNEFYQDRGKAPEGSLNVLQFNGTYQGFASITYTDIPDGFAGNAFFLEVMESGSTGSTSAVQKISRRVTGTSQIIRFERLLDGGAWGAWSPQMSAPPNLPTGDYTQVLTADKTGSQFRWLTPPATAMWIVGDDLTGDAFWSAPFIVLTKDKTLPALDLTKAPYGNYQIVGAPAKGLPFPTVLMNSSITWAAASTAKICFIDCAVYLNADFDTISSGNSKLIIKHIVEGLNNANVPYLVGNISPKSKWRNKGMVSIDSNNFLLGVEVNWSLSNSTDYLLIKGDTNASGFCSVASNGIMTLNCSNVFVESHTASPTTYAYQAVNLAGTIGGSFRGTVYDAFTGDGILGFNANASYPALDLDSTNLKTLNWAGNVIDTGVQSKVIYGKNLLWNNIDSMENCLKVSAAVDVTDTVTDTGDTINCTYDFQGSERHIHFMCTVMNPTFLNAGKTSLYFNDLRVLTPQANFIVPQCVKFDVFDSRIQCATLYLSTGTGAVHLEEVTIITDHPVQVGHIGAGSILNCSIDAGASATCMEGSDGFTTFAMTGNIFSAPIGGSLANAFPEGQYFNSTLIKDQASGDSVLRKQLGLMLNGKTGIDDWKAMPQISLFDVYNQLRFAPNQKIDKSLKDEANPATWATQFGEYCTVTSWMSCNPTNTAAAYYAVTTVILAKSEDAATGYSKYYQTVNIPASADSWIRWGVDGSAWGTWRKM